VTARRVFADVRVLPQSVTARHVAWLTPLIVLYVLVCVVASRGASDESDYIRHANNLTDAMTYTSGLDRGCPCSSFPLLHWISRSKSFAS
jgi:hypothetical protein